MPVIDPQTGAVTIPGWPKGMDNRRSDFDLPDGVLRDAVNVDILTSGNVRSRSGIIQAIISTGAHSVFADDNHMVWATASKLFVCDTAYNVTTVLTDNRLADPISCVSVNGEIYFSNEKINGKITSAGAYTPWGIIPPQVAPTCVGSAINPAILTRQYQVTCTFVTDTGEESGAPLGATVLCGDIPKIQLSNIPQSLDARVVATRIYVTDVDDTIFTIAADVPAGTTSWLLTGYFARGALLKTQFNANPPPGQLLEYHNGCIYIASGDVLWATLPLRYNMVDNIAGFLPFSERITMVKGVGEQGIREHSGLYVSADQTYFMPFTGTAEMKAWPKLPYKAIEGAAMRLPNSPNVMWFSERGFVEGAAGGVVTNLTEAQIAVDKYARGALGYTEINGHKAAIAIMQTALIPSFASADMAPADVLRQAEIV